APAQPDTSSLRELEALLLEMVNGGVLTRREGWLIARHYGLDGDGGRTYTEMARELAEAATRHGAPKQAVSRQRIEQLMRPAIRKLRQYVLANGHTTWQVLPANGTLQGQRKRLSSASITDQSDGTESPKTRSTRRTSVDSSQETAASQPATPLRLPAHSSTK